MKFLIALILCVRLHAQISSSTPIVTRSFSRLGSASSGARLVWCSDCRPAGTVCAAGGTGSLAMRRGGVWSCQVGVRAVAGLGLVSVDDGLGNVTIEVDDTEVSLIGDSLTSIKLTCADPLPASPTVGEIACNAAGAVKVRTASAWIDVGASGGAGASYSVCLLFTGCTPMGADRRTILGSWASSGQLTLSQVSLPGTIFFNNWLQVFAANGAGNGYSCGVFSDATDTPGARLAHFSTLPATGFSIGTGTWASGSAATGSGIVWVGCVSEGTALETYGVLGGTSLTYMYALGERLAGGGIPNLPLPRVVRCSNTAAGTGATFAVPATCGTATPFVSGNLANEFFPSVITAR